MENLTVIMDYIREKYPQLSLLKDRSYWVALDRECKAFAAEIGLGYVTNGGRSWQDFNARPVIVNYFYHQQLRRNNRSDKDSVIGMRKGIW